MEREEAVAKLSITPSFLITKSSPYFSLSRSCHSVKYSDNVDKVKPFSVNFIVCIPHLSSILDYLLLLSPIP